MFKVTDKIHHGQQETYTYDPARQVESASIPLTGGTRTNGYQYDAAANRSTATTNGVTTSYFANALNAYTSIGSFTHSHDANGNLLTGQVLPLGSSSLVSCVFTWNIHNELITATAANGDTAQYQYDALGRRTKRTETIGGVPLSTWFLTNGWNVELEYENGAYARRMTWGQDLSQTLQGAGGVGGLVMFEELPPGGGAPIPSFPTYDGNGNITAWVNVSGTVIARLRYDAFGNIIEQTGTAPSRYGFSTKPIELVTGFLYYGYRYYDSITGRWPSRDPIEEMGGVNLYGFVGNDGVNQLDALGLCSPPDCESQECACELDTPVDATVLELGQVTVRDRVIDFKIEPGTITCPKGYEPIKVTRIFGDMVARLTSMRHEWTQRRPSECEHCPACPNKIWTTPPRLMRGTTKPNGKTLIIEICQLKA